MNEREIFILDAQATMPDGTIQQVSSEESKAIMAGSDTYKKWSGQGTVDVTITWLEGTPEQIMQMLGLDALLEEKEEGVYHQRKAGSSMDFPHISDSTIAEIQALEEANKPYWRLFVDRDDEPCVVCLQPFDEHDYDQKRFINQIRYGSSEQAEDALSALKLKADMPPSNLDRLKIASLREEGGKREN